MKLDKQRRILSPLKLKNTTGQQRWTELLNFLLLLFLSHDKLSTLPSKITC